MMAQSLGEGGSEGERERGRVGVGRGEGGVGRGEGGREGRRGGREEGREREGGMEKEGEATTSVACNPETFGRLWGASPAHHTLLCFARHQPPSSV